MYDNNTIIYTIIYPNKTLTFQGDSLTLKYYNHNDKPTLIRYGKMLLLLLRLSI